MTTRPDLCNYSILVNVNGRIYPYSLVVFVFGLRLEAQKYVWSFEVSSKLVGTKLVRVGVGFVVTLSEDQLGLRVIVLVINGVRTTHAQTLTTLSPVLSLFSLSLGLSLSHSLSLNLYGPHPKNLQTLQIERTKVTIVILEGPRAQPYSF